MGSVNKKKEKKNKSPLANATVREALVDASLHDVLVSQARGFRTDKGKTSKMAPVLKTSLEIRLRSSFK